ncbi:MAG: hypothetical protein U1E10_01295 [Bdellovibrionales bacterium]|jgi:hypothetical protein|nr:hypothetical protein [Bdellovibrionales bacterium]
MSLKKTIPTFLTISLWMSCFSFCISAHAQTEGLTSPFDPSSTTLIHVIRIHRIEDWKREFLQMYLDRGGPPKEWIRVGPWHGIMVNDIPKVDLEAFDYESAVRHSFFYGDLDEAEYLRRRQTQNFSYIVFVANPKAGSKWLIAGPGDQVAKSYRRRWWMNPKNWFRYNDFLIRYLFRMWSDWRMPFRHSAMYDDVKALGHIKAPTGAKDAASPVYSAVVTNEKQFESTKLFIPKELSGTGQSMVIYSGPGGRSCGDLFVPNVF